MARAETFDAIIIVSPANIKEFFILQRSKCLDQAIQTWKLLGNPNTGIDQLISACVACMFFCKLLSPKRIVLKYIFSTVKILKICLKLFFDFAKQRFIVYLADCPVVTLLLL